MWAPDMEEQQQQPLKAKTIDEFRARLKSSFGTALPPTEAIQTDKVCIICTEVIRKPSALSRKCSKAPHPCSGPTCSCADRTSVCYGCHTEMLWKSPRSQPGLGRFRASCPACNGEFCHYGNTRDHVRIGARELIDSDVLEYIVPDIIMAVAEPRPVRSRHSLRRQCNDTERARAERWHKERAAPPDGPGLEDTIRRFALTVDGPQEMPLPKLSGAERAIAHKVAEALGLEHVSQGEGAKRCLWLKKRTDGSATQASDCDELLCKGYVALQGPSVEFHASEHVGAVDADWRAMREDRDGVQHHITILSRGEVETLSQQRTGAKKIGKEFLSDLLWSFVDAVPNDWVALGLGRVAHEDTVAVFVVLEWPAANALRVSLGLPPQDFHVTLGFSRTDVHGVRKDKSTLVPRRNNQ